MKTFILIFLLSPFLIFAQGSDNCSTAAVICANQSQFASNAEATISTCAGCEDGASPSGNSCFELNNTIWFTFMTNATGGDVDVSITNIQCENNTNQNTALQGAIIFASTPCDESTYSFISNCESGSNADFTLSATNLPPNTTYYVQIDGDSTLGNSEVAKCGFNIVATGTGIDVEIDAGQNSTISQGEIASLQGTGPANSVWSPPSIVTDPSAPSTTTSPDVSTSYFYSTTTTNGCVYKDIVTVVVERDILITNTFSPNDDGINDVWLIPGIDKYEAVKVNIFDRWGQEIFRSVGYGKDKTWNGTLNGARLPSGVYYYIIDLNTDRDDDVYAGYVTIIK